VRGLRNRNFRIFFGVLSLLPAFTVASLAW